MKISKEQLREIIRQEGSRLAESAPFPIQSRAHPEFVAALKGRPIREQGSPGPYRDHFTVTDVDNDRPIATAIYTNYGMVTVSFGNSFTLHIDASSAQELGASIQEAGLQLEDLESGRNPGGKHRMKITKRQLRRIIKEEKRKLLREQFTRATFNVSIEAIDPEMQLPDAFALVPDLQAYLSTWAKSVGAELK